jgi:hypothetical protein
MDMKGFSGIPFVRIEKEAKTSVSEHHRHATRV